MHEGKETKNTRAPALQLTNKITLRFFSLEFLFAAFCVLGMICLSCQCAMKRSKGPLNSIAVLKSDFVGVVEGGPPHASIFPAGPPAAAAAATAFD